MTHPGFIRGKTLASVIKGEKVEKRIDTGAQLRIPGEGHSGPFGGPRGDLVINVRVHDDAVFTRKGDNLHCEVPVTKIYPPKAPGYTKMAPITGWWSMLRPIVYLTLGLKE